MQKGQTIRLMDELARRSLVLTREEIAEGRWAYGKPWLDLDVEAFRCYRTGETDKLPSGWGSDPAQALMLHDVRGANVLCLAGGGGQQSALYSLLGAKVTVLDLTPEQLDLDEQTAQRYGYEVATIQGDMRDLSMLPSDAFDRVCQPISSLYVPDLRQVYRGVARVLKPGGLYSCEYTFPLFYMAEEKGWDGAGYVLRISVPYQNGAILETNDGRMNFSQGTSFAEFHHLHSDIINGLIAERLAIRGLWESPRQTNELPLDKLEPGSDEHKFRYLPFGLSVVAEKNSA